MVCLAISRKYNGYCVAGKQITGHGKSAWIRPVSARMMGELSLDLITCGGKDGPCLLDVVKLPLKKSLPHYYQTENHLINRLGSWEKTGRLEPENLAGLQDPVDLLWENGYQGGLGTNDRIPIEIAKERCESSLVLIRPRDFSLVLTRKSSFKQKIRAKFTFNGIVYNLAVTDIFTEKNSRTNRRGLIRQQAGIRIFASA